MNYSKEDFNSVWKDTSKENILNQFYYEHIELQQVQQRINKAIEYINNQMYSYDDGEDCGVDCCCDGFKLLEILKGDK